MKKINTFVVATLILLFLATSAPAPTRTYRAGILTVNRWLTIYSSGYLINNGYYEQVYEGNVADAFKVDYRGTGYKILDLRADGVTVLELTKTGSLGLTGNLDVSDRVAIGSDASIATNISLATEETDTRTSGFGYGQRTYYKLNPATASSGTYFGNWNGIEIIPGNTQNFSDIIWGAYNQAQARGTGTILAVIGNRGQAWASDAGNVSYLTGVTGVARNEEGNTTYAKAVQGEVTQAGTGGQIDDARAFTAYITNTTGTMVDVYGYYFRDGSGSAPITNLYGLYLETPTKGGTLNYSIYSVGGNSYLGGNFGVGDLTPVEGKVVIDSGTATALAISNTISDDTQEAITLTISADADGDDVYGIVQALNTGTGTLDTGDREVFGIKQNITVAADYDSTDYWLANAQGIYAVGTVSGDWASAYGQNNFFTVSGGSSSAVGVRNTLLVSGSDIGEGDAGGIGVYNLIMSASDANTQNVFGMQSLLLSHDTDNAYHSYVTDHPSTSGGTQYGLWVDLDHASSTNYSIWVESGSGDSVIGSEMVFTPSADQVIDAVGDTILANARTIYLNPDGDYTLTSTPTIADGTKGEVLKIMCNNGEANVVTIQDQDTLGGSNLQLQAATRALTGKKVLNLVFDGTDWLEESYANN